MDFQLNLDAETVEQAHPVPLVSVAPDATVADALQQMRKHGVGGLVVCRDERLVGIFTERDAIRLIADGDDLNVPIEEKMIRDPVTLSSSDTVGKAIAMMSEGGYRRLPIVDSDGRPSGMLKVSGILSYLVEHFPNVVYTLPPKPHHSMQEREGA